MNYYNEFCPDMALWLKGLIRLGYIPKGDVDTRSIADVKKEDLVGYHQCHFFSGLSGWSEALRLARFTGPCWTGSCPCQPFSSAGKREGNADSRNLWPEFHRLIDACRPPIVFGEQVASNAVVGSASKVGRVRKKVGGSAEGSDAPVWLDGIRADLERSGYTVGASVLAAAGCGTEGEGWVRRGGTVARERLLIGAPHIRQRLYWVGHRGDYRRLANTSGAAGQRNSGGLPSPEAGECGPGQQPGDHALRSEHGGSDDRGLANAEHKHSGSRVPGIEGLAGSGRDRPAIDGDAGRLADADGGKPGDRHLQRGGEHGQQSEDGGTRTVANPEAGRRGEGDPVGGGCGGGVCEEGNGQRPTNGGLPRRLGNPGGSGHQGHARDGDGGGEPGRECAESAGPVRSPSGPCGLANSDGSGSQSRGQTAPAAGHGSASVPDGGSDHWADYRVAHCTDGKARRFGTGFFPLAPRVSGEVAVRLPSGEEISHSASIALKGIGNAITVPLAAEFVAACMEAIGDE